MVMTSITNQRTAELRLPWLMKTHCTWRGVSAEPLSQAVWLDPWMRGLDWLIVGGISGNTVKTLERQWLTSLVEQTRRLKTPLFIKQLGNGYADAQDGIAGAKLQVPPEAEPLISKRLKHSKGADMDEWPVALRIRQVPRFVV
jgi:protein gp37